MLILVEDGRIALDDPVGTWPPELASPVVVRTPVPPALMRDFWRHASSA